MYSELIDSMHYMEQKMFNVIHNVEMPSKMSHLLLISSSCQNRWNVECSLPELHSAWKLQSLRESQNCSMLGNKNSFSCQIINFFDLIFCHHNLLSKPNVCAKFEWNQWSESYYLQVQPDFLLDTLLKVKFDCTSLYSDSTVRCSIMENVLKSIASLVSHVIT